MEDAYQIEFLKAAIADLAALDKQIRVQILKRIELRLAHAPHRYGVPLRHTFKGLHKLRVGDYRAVFIIEGATVTIVAVDLRSVVYEKLLRRLE